MHLFYRVGFLLTLFGLCGAAMAQPKLEFNLKKPKQFEERKLGSEKNVDKKFSFPRRVFQNTVTRFNYYFNANLKLNEIVDEARRQNKDDYTKLLPFYTYSFDNTAKNPYIDSILQKCTAGILLHDLRNDWIDNLYLIMGRAYLLRKDYDSAAMTFQFLNYSYAPKEKGGYDLPIGSNATEGGSAFSISTKEKKGPTAYLLGEPPSRNEAFLWQVRTLTENGNYIDASSLIQILGADPQFPARLKEELHQARAYIYYKVAIWDSSAAYLLKAMPTAFNQDEKARWYFLAGQMFQLANQPKAASEAFAKSSDLALDPVMDIYARLNSIRLRKSDDPKIIDDNIATVLGMAKKDRYTNYRDIIYYAAALFELERDGFAAAENYLKQSLSFPQNSPGQRSQTFLLLGDLAFTQKKYGAAAAPYDSTDANLLAKDAAKRIEDRSPGCHKILAADNTITLADSLLKIANMPEAERIDLVKSYSKKLRKARGLKDETEAANANTTGSAGNTTAAAGSNADLFSAGGTKWYFTDMPQRTSGFQKFKDRWGARPNTDNWRRSATQRSNFPTPNAAITKTPGAPTLVDPNSPADTEAYDTADVSFDNLYSRLPLDPIKQKKANDRINTALFAKAEALHNDIEDYPEAIKVYELLLSRLDTGLLVQQSLFALVHCYTKTGNISAANSARQKQSKQFGVNTTAAKTDVDAKTKAAGTETYKGIYNLFLEGRFAEAVAKKQEADSLYGTYFWTPQLLYIESIFQIKSRQDSAAINTLTNIENTFANHPLAKRAQTLKDVLSRRTEIENYLTQLKITRASEDETTVFGEKPLDKKPQQSDSTLQSNLLLKAERQRQLDSSVSAQQAAFAAMEAKRKVDSATSASQLAQLELDRRKDSAAQAKLLQKARADRRQDSLQQVKQQKLARESRAKDSLAQAQLQKLAASEKRKDSLAQAKLEQQLRQRLAKDSIARINALKTEAAARAKDSLYQDNLRKRQEAAALKQDVALQAALAKEAEQAKAKQAADAAAKAKQLAAEQRKDSLERVQLAKQQQAARTKDSLSQDRLEKQARAARTKDSLAPATLAQQAANMRIKDSLNKADLARQQESKRVADSLKLIADYRKSNPNKPAVFVINNIVSPYMVEPAAPHMVAIVLEKIDPAYVNEVAYAFNSNPMRHKGDTLVQSQKIKLSETLWLVTLQSSNFNTAQDAIDYMEYIKPIAKSSIISWLDESKYQYMIVSARNLALIKQPDDLSLYRKVLAASLPEKF
jgi:hypothetical protein